jgi:hypothetical protein
MLASLGLGDGQLGEGGPRVVLRAVSWFEREPRAWAADRCEFLRVFRVLRDAILSGTFRNHAEQGESRARVRGGRWVGGEIRPIAAIVDGGFAMLAVMANANRA